MGMKKNARGSRRGILRWFLTCLTLLWMLFIFMMSSAGKDESNTQSGAVCEIICEVFVEGYEEMPEEDRIRLQEKISFPVRKGAHLSEYAVLGALMTVTAAFWRREETNTRTTQVLPVLGAGFLYAVSDEMHQAFVPGRSGEPRDVLIDTFGVLIGICIVRVCLYARARKKDH